MSTPDNITTSSQPPRKPSARWLLVAMIPIVSILAVKLPRPDEWRPDLHLKNAGTSAVTVLYHDQTSTTPPGETWRTRVRAGETITVRAGTLADAPSATLTFPARNPKPGSSIAQRWSADVIADDPKNIRFENRVYADVTDPPSRHSFGHESLQHENRNAEQNEDLSSPKWHEEILDARKRSVESGESELITLEELKTRLSSRK